MTGRFPRHGVLGAAMVALFWVLNWSLDGFRTHLLFFPLWFGYALAVDGLAYWRQGHSLISRSGWRFAWLFALSVPVWWLFEALNARTQNWSYVGTEELGDAAYAFWASVNFSTVIPAVFVTAETVNAFIFRGPALEGFPPRQRILSAPGAFIALGVVMLAALLAFPNYAYPFMWLSVFFIVDPINALSGRRSLLQQMRANHWQPAVALAIAALICGFFWELWNYYSNPKWIYRIPFLGFGKVFEMPILGYGGYVPFAWELYALYQLVRRPLGAPRLAWEDPQDRATGRR